MASAAAPTTFALIKTTTSSSLSSPRACFLHLPTSSSCRLGFSAAESLLTCHVALRVSSIKTKGTRAVVSMAKKSVGELRGADSKGKKVFVRAGLNVPLDDTQDITDNT